MPHAPAAFRWMRIALLLAVLVGLVAFFRYRSALPDQYVGYVSDTSGSEPWVPALLADTSSLYLPDYSYAGYRWSSEPLPQPPVTHHAADFGAVPDDGLDDTEALRSALQAVRRDTGWVVLELPAGQLDLNGVLFLERDSLVLRGQVAKDGSPSTILSFSGSLTGWNDPKADSLVADIAAYQEANNLTNLFRPYSPYTWAGGALWSRRAGPAFPIPAIPPLPAEPGEGWKAENGRQGEHRIIISSEREPPQPGDELEIRWANRDGGKGAFLDHVVGTYDLPIGERLTEDPNRPLVTQPATIVAIDEHPEGWALSIHEPLLHDIRGDWSVRLVGLDRLSHLGIEHLDLRFEPSTPAPHHLDKGYNGIYLTDTRDSWMLNLHIRDADTAVLTNRTNQITLSGLHTSGREGHHSVYPSNSYGVLTRDFLLEAPALHHPTFPTGSVLNVYTGGIVRHARLDQHGGLNQQNLYDNLTVDADNVWLYGGGAGYWNPVAGRFNTFWNVTVTSDHARAGTVRDAPDARIIGLYNEGPDIRFRYGPNTHVEGLQRGNLAVPSLFDWQLERRLRLPGSVHQP